MAEVYGINAVAAKLFSNSAPWTAASASPAKLLEMQILGPYSDLLDQKLGGGGVLLHAAQHTLQAILKVLRTSFLRFIFQLKLTYNIIFVSGVQHSD